MSNIPTKAVTGDVSVTRNVSAGGDASVAGNARVMRDLVVEGWLEAPNIRGECKGLFRTPGRLEAAYPEPGDGWYALVGDTLPAALYFNETLREFVLRLEIIAGNPVYYLLWPGVDGRLAPSSEYTAAKLYRQTEGTPRRLYTWKGAGNRLEILGADPPAIGTLQSRVNRHDERLADLDEAVRGLDALKLWDAARRGLVLPFASEAAGALSLLTTAPYDTTIETALASGSVAVVFATTAGRFALKVDTGSRVTYHTVWHEVADAEGAVAAPASTLYVAGKAFVGNEPLRFYTWNGVGAGLVRLGDYSAINNRLKALEEAQPGYVRRVDVTADAARLEMCFYDGAGNQVSAAARIPSAARVDALEETLTGADTAAEAVCRYIKEIHGDDPRLMDGRAWEIKKSWNPATTKLAYSGDKELTYFPMVDTPALTSMASAFFNDGNLREIAAIDTSRVTSFAYCFYGCAALEAVPDLDTSAATAVTGMFNGCGALTAIPAFDVSGCASLSHFVGWCGELRSVPALDTGKSASFYNMFAFCAKLAAVGTLDTSSGTNFEGMFKGCGELAEIPDIDISNATKINDMLAYCYNLRKATLKGLGGAALENASYCFGGARLWGYGSEANRQSLVDTLLNLSNDRAAGELDTLALELPAATLGRLTDEEIAAITAKGYTLATA